MLSLISIASGCGSPVGLSADAAPASPDSRIDSRKTNPIDDSISGKKSIVDFGAVVSGTGNVQRYFLLPNDVLNGDISRVLTSCPCLQAKIYGINHRAYVGRIVELTVDSGHEISMPTHVQVDIDLHFTSGKFSKFKVGILFLSSMNLRELLTPSSEM